MDSQLFIHDFSWVDKIAAPNRNMCYPQVPGSIPAETLRIHIYVDLSY